MGAHNMTREQKRMARRLRSKGLTLKAIARDLSCSLPLVKASVYAQREEVGRPDRWKPAPGHLSAEEREEILLGLGRKESMSAIARSLGRAPSTITREVAANGGAVGYGAWRAHCRAEVSSRRPKPAKLAHPPLARQVTAWLERLWSPQEIAERLRLDFGDDPMTQVSHETIYQSLFGAGNKSAVGTLVERWTRFVLLLHLPDGYAAANVERAMRKAIKKLPDELTRSVTWDQGHEMAGHVNFTVATGIPVYFCDPHSPWQRGSNENTNGLLRQYMP